MTLKADVGSSQGARSPSLTLGRSEAQSPAGFGSLHTEVLAELNEIIKLQHSGAFHEDSDGEIIIPSGVTPQTAYVKLDVSWLAEAAIHAVLSSEALSRKATEGEAVGSALHPGMNQND